MRWLLRRLTDYLPCRIIAEEGSPYLERYYLFTILGWRFYLHQFVGSDPDRGLHDHPWSRAYSIILAGWYWEHTRSGPRRVRWFNSLTGDTFHRVVLPHARYEHLIPENLRKFARACGAPVVPCWTLFFHRAGDVKRWGFMREIPDTDGVATFEPYRYAREGFQKHWWKTASKGRQARMEGRAA